MKKILILISFLFALQFAQSQSVMSSAGQVTTNNSHSVSYTVGETIVNTTIGEKIVTQGFQQPKIKLITSNNDIGEATDFEIYPNPTLAILHIKNANNISKIEVINALGQTLFSTDKRVENIDLSDYPNGSYFVRMINLENNIFVKQIVKQ
jgi:Secretion system C-terminal sorting domain